MKGMIRPVCTILGGLVILGLVGCGLFESDDQELCCGDLYVDDMEDITDIRSFSVLREAWVPASPPGGYAWEDTRRIWWYVKDREVRMEDLFPQAESKPGESYLPVLEIDFRDFRYSQAWITSDPTSDWGGLMQSVSPSGVDYSDLSFFRIWLRQKNGDVGTIHIDLGEISENFYNPWVPDSLHTEDRDGDGMFSVDENTGLDGVFTGEPGDDPYDDWGYSEGDYSRINGTEGDPRYLFDTEDLDGNGYLDTDNVHFRLSVDLADTTYFAAEGRDGWRQYKIPLYEAYCIGGLPGWDSITSARFCFTDVDSPCVFQVAYLEIGGFSWHGEGIRLKADMAWVAPQGEERFDISTKNTQEDPDYFPPYDPGKDAQGYARQEQSMAFSLRFLAPGHSGSVCRTLPGVIDLTSYRNLGFYVYGDEAISEEDLHMFVRVGADSLNFYEYGIRVDPGWKSMEVPFEQMTDTGNLDPDTRTIYGSVVIYRSATTETGWIAVYGEPSLSHIAWLGAGAVNTGAATTRPRIEVWFNDLRLTGFRR
jgi:hypothetical protein